MRRDIVWERLDRPGIEHVALEIRPDAVRAESLVLLGLDEGLARIRYTVECDGAWRTHRADFALELGRDRRVLALRRNDAGRWTANGRRREELDACFDIDFVATPLTNTLALKRLGPKSGEPRRMHAAYVALPTLEVRVDEQEYTLLSPILFRYRGISTGFAAEVTMDADRLVVDYPPGWKRRAP